MRSTRETPHRTFELGKFSIDVATGAGPRILRVLKDGVDGMFADLPELGLETPSGALFSFLGGHRLWRAPEEPETTYEPDDGGVEIVAADSSIVLTGMPDSDLISRRITVGAVDDYLVVDHVLTNLGESVVSQAPWAITQLEPGGTAYLPHPEPSTRRSVSPDRSVVLWPYTSFHDPDIALDDAVVTVFGSDRVDASKVGLCNRRGWTAYHRGGSLFVKWSPLHRDDRRYADLNASVQCYRNSAFVELESLGELVDLEPGGSASHREVWSVMTVGSDTLDATLRSLPAVPVGGPS